MKYISCVRIKKIFGRKKKEEGEGGNFAKKISPTQRREIF